MPPTFLSTPSNASSQDSKVPTVTTLTWKPWVRRFSTIGVYFSNLSLRVPTIPSYRFSKGVATSTICTRLSTSETTTRFGRRFPYISPGWLVLMALGHRERPSEPIENSVMPAYPASTVLTIIFPGVRGSAIHRLNITVVTDGIRPRCSFGSSG